MGNRNRQKGHDYEREIRLNFIGLGFEECMTSRYASTYYDDSKIDLVNTGCFHVQCKNSIAMPLAYHAFLDEMPDWNRYNIVFHKYRGKRQYCILSFDDFMEIVGMLINENLLSNSTSEEITNSRNFNYNKIFKEELDGVENAAIVHTKPGYGKYVILRKMDFLLVVKKLVDNKVIDPLESWLIAKPSTPESEDIL